MLWRRRSSGFVGSVARLHTPSTRLDDGITTY